MVCSKGPPNAIPLEDDVNGITVDGDSWLFKSPPNQTRTPNHDAMSPSSNASTPTSPTARRNLWEVLTGSPASPSSAASKVTVFDDYVQGDNINGTILRLVDNGKSSLVHWATIEQGMLKYFRQKPIDASVRPLGYVTLTGAKIKVADSSLSANDGSGTVDAKAFEVKKVNGRSLHIISIFEDKLSAPFVFGFINLAVATRWLQEIGLTIRGKDQPAVYLSHGKGVAAAGKQSQSVKKLQEDNHPSKTGAMKKKALGKKKILYRTWKKRYFRLQAGELRYYSDKSFRTSSLKGTINLADCPGYAIVSGTPAIELKIPLPKGLYLICNCTSEVDCMDWMELINKSIALSKKGGRGRASTAGKTRGKRMVIVADHLDEENGVEAKKWKKSAKTLEVLNGALKGHFLFEKAPDFGALLDALQPLDAKQGDCVIWEGDVGDKFYILEAGTCSVVKGGNVLAFQQTMGSAFGELALIHNAPRAASIRAIEDCKLWQVDRHNFRHALNEMENGMHNTQVKFLKNISLFGDLNGEVLGRIADAMKVAKFKDGERIIKQGEDGEEFFMIKSGNVIVTQKASNGVEKTLTKCGPGDYFGELALMQSEPRAASVTATGPVDCFSLDRKNFDEVLGPLQELLALHKGIQLMKKVKMLSENLNEYEMEQISKSLQHKVVSDGTRIIKQGEKGDLFYMIEKGTVTISIDNTEVATLTGASPTPYFGEMALISDDIRAATVIADGSVQLSFLTRQNFNQLLGPMKDIMKRVSDSREQENNVFAKAFGRLGRVVSKSIDRKSARSESGGRIADFPFSAMVEKRVLGTGTFGIVKLVQDGRDGKPYAMKVMRKKQVMDSKQLTNVYAERELMEKLIHPLILRLFCSYQDDNALFLLLELVPGGELWSLLHGDTRILPQTSLGGISLAHTKFYTSNVLAAIQHFHEKEVAYRDLKPENLVIDGEGYIKVIDLGFAKIIPHGEKSNTLCGTPEYLAPELVLSRGHSTPVDIWAIGILVYELLTNCTPFEDDEPTDMFRKIAHPKENLKKAFVRAFDKKSKKLVEQILEENPVKRLGCRKGGIAELWSNPWFDGFTAEMVERKALNAPFVPELKGPLDVVNFDDYEDFVEDVDNYSYTGPSEPFRKWGNMVKT